MVSAAGDFDTGVGRSETIRTDETELHGHQMSGNQLECPFCGAYEVDRLYLGTVHIDACTCTGCGARWDQDSTTGRYRGRGNQESVVTPRNC